MSARFTLLEDAPPRWRAFGAGTGLQIFLLTLLIVGPMLLPQRLIPVARYDVIPLALPRTVQPLPPKPQPVRVKVQLPPEPVEPPKVAKLFAPAQPLAPKPKPRPAETAAPTMKPVFASTNLNTPKAEPRRPREDVKTGVLTTGSAAPATVNRPLHQVQTGGFGDPDGIPANKSNPGKRANIAQRGSFDLPGGPGYGNGTGGASGVRGTVASAGFGSGIAIPPKGSGGGARGPVRQGGFAEATVAPAETQTAKSRSSSGAGATQPVEIVFKPNPVYTEEARRRRIEGEVLVDVVFTASGDVRVIRVVRGLGSGLDEAALRAAQQIRFKPARRDGQPVDFPATVHIVFQLAY